MRSKMDEPFHPLLRIQAMKYSNYMVKFAIINGSELAKFTLKIDGKSDSEKYRDGRFTMIDEEAAEFLSLEEPFQVRLFPDEFLTYRLKINRDHPSEKIWFRLCREFRSRSGRKMTVTYVIPLVIEEDGIHIKKQKKQFAVKVW
ncbi:uncharacterized protein LOC134838246 [Culicoides brevitarsis]|uniref:uncharacterized protein LOC134838246 n=1 Tax=Culicoides brevitarsis TaxID=469753 RepID=UPI00307C2286